MVQPGEREPTDGHDVSGIHSLAAKRISRPGCSLGCFAREIFGWGELEAMSGERDRRRSEIKL